MKAIRVSMLVLIAFTCVGPRAVRGVEYEQTPAMGEILQTYVGPGSSYFGSSFAPLGEGRILIGASGARVDGFSYAGAALLHDVDSGALLRTFENPTPRGSEWFGVSVAALDSSRFAVGARGDDDQGPTNGIAYLYDADTGGLLTTFHNPNTHFATSDEFGQSVATLGGDRVLVGAYREDARGYDAGAAYLFDADSGAHLQSFFSPNPHGEDHFGFTVAGLGDDRVLISSHRDDVWATDAGGVYMFDANTAELLYSFYHPTPEAADYFGWSIAPVGADKVLIGAYGDDTGAANAGAAYLFDADSGQLLQTFLNPTPAEDDNFGSAVGAINDQLIVIGAPREDTLAQDTGAAYVFDVFSGDLLTTINNPFPAPNERFGSAFAGVANGVFIGSTNSREAYLFAVPEPSALALLAMGVLGMLVYTCRSPMGRIARRVTALMFVVSCICSAHESALAQPADSSWPVFGQDARGQRQSPFVGPSSTPQQKWVFQADDTVYASPAISADGSILVPTFGGTLYCLDRQSGETNWMFQSGEQMSCSPSVDAVGTIYQKTSKNGLYALNSDGSTKWFASEPQGYRSGTVIGLDGTVYVGQSTEPRLLAYSADGILKWACPTPKQVEGTPVIDSTGVIYVGAEDHHLYAVDVDGTEKWSFNIPGRNVASATIGDDGTIYAGGQSGDLFAINPDGSEKWRFSEANDIFTSVALGQDGSIYLAASDGVYGLAPDGTKKWFYPDRSYVHGSPMVDAAGHIFLSRNERAISLSADGDLLWTYEAESLILSSVIMDDEGSLYFGTSEGFVHALAVPEPSSAVLLAMAGLGIVCVWRRRWQSIVM